MDKFSGQKSAVQYLYPRLIRLTSGLSRLVMGIASM